MRKESLFFLAIEQELRLQLEGAMGDQRRSIAQAIRDFDHPVGCHARADVDAAKARRGLLDKHECLSIVLHDGRFWNRQDFACFGDRHPHLDELSGTQRAAWVVNRCDNRRRVRRRRHLASDIVDRRRQGLLPHRRPGDCDRLARGETQGSPFLLANVGLDP